MENIEKIIKNTTEENQNKVNWTKAWSTKYPILKTYQKEVDIPKYANEIRRLLNELQEKYDYKENKKRLFKIRIIFFYLTKIYKELKIILKKRKKEINMKVKDCMCENVCCVKPETKINEIAKLMDQNHIGCVPVCDNNNCLVGMITDRDIILRSVACDKDVKNTPASEIMSCNVCCCNENDDILDAEAKMATNQIRRIPVVENNKVVGILTLGDLTHYDEKIGKDNFCNTIENICDCKGQTKNNC